MRTTRARLVQFSRAFYHENPLGLPRSGTPPSWPKRPQRRKIHGVEKVIAVSSAKGGVGKSTIAANLSLAFARLGFRSGILDTDIFGPSIPTLFDLSGEPRLSANNQLVPLTNYGVKTMSMGYLVGESAPVVWRGPMVMKAIQQLLHEVEWGGLDILVLDLPPGTGDTQLTITQQIMLDGSVIVTTPHILATKDAVKGINMFKTVGVDILGLVQNMSIFKCPHCHGETNVFGSNQRVERMCDEHKIEFLGDIPLSRNIGDDGDKGKPTVVSEPTSDRASCFLDIARAISGKISME
ncbi:NUBPL iron-transfer p-loop NTPase domain-containing protein [Hirsutella rhossiliensis]|uniref:NUBPL iron-transfer p-loop NTPase domain-containing protein n=1 Tax=Hirsutella rhossiliensis TaxID=111463 RepID=A0A9P8MT89_9HYPO|nr:NUBPL iron-transfer p-loop NTPase domain-containing protein [Hirsutella rhossiliensis]KAH0961568.1 NUBPL iron-transfer p-loop NTPase domain-containing protein [Hirsutella rhossiliensis]